MLFQAIITKERDATIASFPDCPGCHTQADPGEDIVQLAREALSGWLEAHLVQGRVPPLPTAPKKLALPKNRVIDVDVPPLLAARILVRVTRHKAGLSQTELAQKVNVSQQQIAALESPRSNLTLDTLVRVAEALDHKVEIRLLARRSVPKK